MIFKVINWTVMAIAIFYGLEGTGLIERGKYFPTLPRLDASASNPMAWLGAAQWGFNQLGGLATSRTGASFDTGSIPSLSSITGAFGGKGSGGRSVQNLSESLSSAVGNATGGGYRMNYLSGYSR